MVPLLLVATGKLMLEPVTFDCSHYTVLNGITCTLELHYYFTVSSTLWLYIHVEPPQIVLIIPKVLFPKHPKTVPSAKIKKSHS